MPSLLVLPAGRALLLARPGRPVSPAHPGRGGVKGGPKAQRALMSAQRPLTPERGRDGSPSSRQTAGPCGAAERSGSPARQRRRRVEVVVRPARTWVIAQPGQLGGRRGVGARELGCRQV